jgi:hypothetical protein
LGGKEPKKFMGPLKSYRLSGPIYPHYDVEGTYFFIKNKDETINCKWNILSKCQGCRIVVCDMLRLGVKKCEEYVAKDYAHLKNVWLYA